MKSLSCDLETYSSVNLAKSGVFRYCEAEDFEILLFGYSIDSGTVQVVDLAKGERIPDEILKALTDDQVIKWAFNAAFERICLSRYLGLPTGTYLSPDCWRCTMIWSAYLGLPLSLMGTGVVLGLEKQKISEGKELIKYFCTPCTPTMSNGNRTRNLPSDAPDKWGLFLEYNKRDVEVELAIHNRLSRFPVPDDIWDEYHLDQRINDRGVLLDRELVESAINMDRIAREELMGKMRSITDLENPNSVQQLKQWFADHGLEVDSLGKKDVKDLLKHTPRPLQEVLELRLQLAKSSVKKYQAMEHAVCSDGRARGMFQFYGANRTGRWSGRLIQLQNLRRNSIVDLEGTQALVKSGNYEAIKMLYEDVPDTLSQLIRTAFIAAPGHRFLVSDFSAIEARVLSWLAGESWRMAVFKKNGDIYCASATQMFGVQVEKHGTNGHLRQKGKIAELALGYGGSVGALKAMGALESGMSEDELKPLVDAWRQSNPRIVQLWWDVDTAAIKAVRDKTTTTTHGIRFSYESGFLFITLPSARRLAYVKPRIGTNKFGGTSITYEGVGGTKKWERLETYGAKLVENCLAKDTLILTNRGLIPIQDITQEDSIWDGVEWVAHEGLINKETQEIVHINQSIDMTPDHRILTTKGWRECAKSKGFDWAEVQLPDSHQKSEEHPTREGTMAMQMPLRKSESDTFKASSAQKTSSKILRMHDKNSNWNWKHKARNVPSSCFWGMAVNEAAMHRSQPSGLEKLWREGYKGLRSMVEQFRAILEGHGTHIPKRSRSRQKGQQPRLQSRKLPLGKKKNQQQKQEKQSCNRHPIREHDSFCFVRDDGNRSNDSYIPSRSQLANRITVHPSGCKKPVYDLKNCGPRHRFAIWDRKAEKARLVSNCTQAISRDLLSFSMKNLKDYRICMHIHDEVVIEAPADQDLTEIEKIMAINPSWAKGLPLNADGYETTFYKKD